MALDPAKATEYTDADLLKFYRQAMAELSVAQSYTTAGGRTLTKADLPEIRRSIMWLESRLNDSDDTDIGVANFDRPK